MERKLRRERQEQLREQTQLLEEESSRRKLLDSCDVVEGDEEGGEDIEMRPNGKVKEEEDDETEAVVGATASGDRGEREKEEVNDDHVTQASLSNGQKEDESVRRRF